MCADSQSLSDTLEKKRYFNYDLMCTEFTVYTAENQYDQSDPFLFAQSFSNRIHVWWPTAADVEKFLISVKSFFQSQDALTRKCGFDYVPGRHDVHPSCNVYFYLPNYQIEHLQIKDVLLLDAEPLNKIFQAYLYAQMCRITFAGNDLYYDFKPREKGIRRAGIVTGSARGDMIFDYIASTHSRVVQENPLKDILQEILSCMTSS